MLKQKQNKRFFIFIFIFLNIYFYVGPYIDFFFLFLIFIYLFIIIFLLKLINSAAQNHCLPRQKDAYDKLKRGHNHKSKSFPVRDTVSPNFKIIAYVCHGNISV